MATNDCRITQMLRYIYMYIHVNRAVTAVSVHSEFNDHFYLHRKTDDRAGSEKIPNKRAERETYKHLCKKESVGISDFSFRRPQD